MTTVGRVWTVFLILAHAFMAYRLVYYPQSFVNVGSYDYALRFPTALWVSINLIIVFSGAIGLVFRKVWAYTLCWAATAPLHVVWAISLIVAQKAYIGAWWWMSPAVGCYLLLYAAAYGPYAVSE